jgi:alkylation response protein AidB-like acyl-CoA dehydrogenase
MDFGFSEEQEFFRSQVRDAVDRLILPRAAALDEAEEFPRDLWDELAGLGYFGLRHEEKHGGMAADTVTSMIFFEELARGSVGFSMAVTVQMLMGTYFVGRFGSDAIKRRVLEPAIQGQKIAAICFTEDQSGSDLAGTQTRAVRDGDEWVITGRKQWVTNGPLCDFATVLCQTEPGSGLKGLSFFLVENGTPGFERGQHFAKLGSRASLTGELIFDDVRVPLENHLGDELGKGLEYSTDILNLVRVMTLAAPWTKRETSRRAAWRSASRSGRTSSFAPSSASSSPSTRRRARSSTAWRGCSTGGSRASRWPWRRSTSPRRPASRRSTSACASTVATRSRWSTPRSGTSGTRGSCYTAAGRTRCCSTSSADST